ncbi:PopC secretion inhibitor PopD [Hyalangium rubrum]|uniref:DUF2384 domain-containing protein n=1 Tax=Hyalangium rubrum TaxID=3103134 RepID=A0ABU5H2Q1_9BACT|nr:hypothetical protein [Hyalangium sp. s54d21]MDY7226375.1 hypothetical protein [Hyalangium sp. s54d21]
MSRKQNGPGKTLYALPRAVPSVRSLPGSGGEESTSEWIDVTVMPRESSTPRRRAPREVSANRAALYQAGLAESARFRDDLMRWLESHKLMGAVRSVSEPGGSLPMLTLRCAPRVLDQLRRAPEFEAGSSMPLELHS